MSEIEMFVVQVWNGKRWSKVRGVEGGPYLTWSRAARIAELRADETDRQHRVRAVGVAS